MGFGKRDSRRDGSPTAVACPPAVADLERRVDEALATARASEAAVMTVGAAALDAAEQARRAAELAERASAAMLAERPRRPGGSLPAHASSPLLPPEPAAPPLLPPEPVAGEIRVSAAASPVAEVEDERLRGFNLRADRLADRLRALGSRPVSLAA